jgi:predicted nuclease of predicted toxin-antitoxin system
MRIDFLLDENISWRIEKFICPPYQSALHADNAGLGLQPKDAVIMRYAIEHNLVLLTRDDDFTYLSQLSPQPVKVVRLVGGPCKVRELAAQLIAQKESIEAFVSDQSSRLLVLRV